jgi:hypothetical protein
VTPPRQVDATEAAKATIVHVELSLHELILATLFANRAAVKFAMTGNRQISHDAVTLAEKLGAIVEREIQALC